MNDRERAMAMERMIHAHGSELLRLCLLLLGDRASAEDALQDTFVKAGAGWTASAATRTSERGSRASP